MAGYGNRNGGGEGGFERFWRAVTSFLGRSLLLVGLGLALLAAASSSYYQIEPEEVGLITRFGAYQGTAEPGPHFKLPFFDTVFRVPVKRQLKE
jgi:membrane protease subunit HflK